MQVRLMGTKLTAEVPESLVFWYTDDCHRDESDKARYRAWEKVRYKEAPEPWMTRERLDNVFACFAEELHRPCWVVLSKEIYDHQRIQKPANTKAEDIAAEKDRNVLAAKAVLAQEREARGEKLKALFEFIPKICSGVDWGVEGRILLKTKSRLLVYRKGVTAYIDRGAGNAYCAATLQVHEYKKDFKNQQDRYRLEGRHGSTGHSLELPPKWRLSPKGLKSLYAQLEGAMNLPLGTLGDIGFDGTKTITLENP